MSSINFKVDHNKEKNQFKAIVNNEKAFLNYRKIRSNTLEYYETFIPEKEKERKQEVSSLLAKEALTYAKKNQLKVAASCPYVNSYIDKNKEFSDLKVKLVKN